MALGQYPPPWSDGSPDRPGQREPRRFTARSFLSHKGLARVFAAFDKEVPPEFWSEDTEAANSVAIISCPCGEEPHVQLGRTEFCTGCDRVFWHLGDRIKVAKNPDAKPSEETTEQTA